MDQPYTGSNLGPTSSQHSGAAVEADPFAQHFGEYQPAGTDDLSKTAPELTVKNYDDAFRRV